MITNGSVNPSNAIADYGSTYEITCDESFGIHGTGTMTCGVGGNFDQTSTCEGPCNKPLIPNGIVSPTNTTIDFGSTYEVTCDTGAVLLGSWIMTCSAEGNFDQTPTCGKNFQNFAIVSMVFSKQVYIYLYKHILDFQNYHIFAGSAVYTAIIFT